jgi:hypothetical protein
VKPAALVVDERVWREMASLIDEHGEGWSLRLALRARAAEPRLVEAALNDALLAVQQAAEDSVAHGPWHNEWDLLRVADRVVVTLQGSEGAPDELAAVVTELNRRGLSGSIELVAEPPQDAPPQRAPVLTARLRVRGERVRDGATYRWKPDPAAYHTVVTTAASWCGETSVVVMAGTVGWTPTEDRAEALRVMHDAVSRAEFAAYASTDEAGFRSVGAWPQGGISLVAGTWPENDLPWPAVLSDVVEVLRLCAAHTAYASVFRGTNVTGAVRAGEPASVEWPARPNRCPLGPGWTSQSFEDLLAPDIFGVQLLGPGYRDRTIDAPGWASEPLEGGGRLVTARDPAPWFQAPIVEPSTPLPRPPQPPAVLEQGRRELEDILYAPGRLAAMGFVDVDGSRAPSRSA